MGIFDKKNMINIAEEDLNDARLSSIDFTDEEVKKRAFVDVLGARLAMKLLFSKKIEAGNLYSMYTIHNVLGQLDIADIYFNNIKIDVRLVFNENEIFIPKAQFEYNVLPDLYLVLVLNNDSSSAGLLGFFEPDTVDKSNENEDFYFYDKEKLQNPEDLKKFLKGFTVPNKLVSSEEEMERAETLFLSSIDNEISTKDRSFLLKQLSSNFDLRENFVEFENFELLSLKVAKEKDLLKDNVLDIVGAQKIAETDDENLELETIVFNENEETFDLDDLVFDNEEVEQEKTQSDKSLTEKLVKGAAEGALIAGGVALAGAAAAAGIAAVTQGVSGVSAVASGVSGAIGLADGVASLGNSTNFGNNGNSDNGSSLDDLVNKMPEMSGEMPEMQKSELDELVSDELDSEKSPFEAENDFNSDGETDVVENAVETNNIEENMFEELSPLEELEELPELPELGGLEEVEDSGNSEESNSSVETPAPSLQEEPELNIENDSDNDVVDLENFDFDMLDDETEKENSDKNEVEADEALVSFDSLMYEKKEPSEDSFGQDLVEADDIEIEHNEENNDMSDITNQVDELLKQVDLTDEQKNILATEFTIEDEATDSTDGIEPVVFSPTTEELSAATQEQNSEIDLLLSGAEMDADEKDLLKVLFKSENINPDEELNLGSRETAAAEKSKKKKIIIAASVASVMLISLVAGGIVMKGKSADTKFPKDLNTPPISADVQQQNGSATGMPETNSTPDATAAPETAGTPGHPALVDGYNGEGQQYAPQPNRDMGQAVSEAFMSEPVNASVSKVAWEVPEDLAYNDSFRKYLQSAGKNLKLTLQNDLLLATEMAYSNKMIVDLTIDKSGALQSSNIVVSSGSKQIDKIVLQSVKETLKYLKVPSSELSGASVTATLIINF